MPRSGFTSKFTSAFAGEFQADFTRVASADRVQVGDGLVRALAPGTVFDASAGKLCQLGEGGVTVMAAWPRMQAWWRSASHPAWCGCRPHLVIPEGTLDERDHQLYPDRELDGQLLLPFAVTLFHHRRAAIGRFCALIPPDVRDAVRPFRDRQWHALVLVARCGAAALDLVRSNPGLAYMLASSWAFRSEPVARPLRSARGLLGRGRRQQDILEWLGWPGTEAMRRIVRKVVPASFRVVSLRCLRSRVSEPAIGKALQHVPRINANVMRMAWDRSLLQVSPHLLAEAGQRRSDDHFPEFATLLRETLRAWMQVHSDRQPPKLRTISAVYDLYDELGVVLRSHPDVPDDAVVPPAPIAGTKSIQPLTSVPMIREEGWAQHNCLAALAREAVEGRTAFYRMLAPERATLSLVREGTEWRIKQLKAAANRSAKLETWRAVQRWLAKASDCDT